MDNREDQYGERKFWTPSGFLKYFSRYTVSSEELQDLQQNKYQPIYTETLDLTIANPQSTAKIINQPGRAVVIYGVRSDTVYDPVANTGTEITTGANIWCRFNEQNQPGDGMMLKHGRGYIGSFQKLCLTWPAQSLTNARVIIFKWDGTPWLTGEGV